MGALSHLEKVFLRRSSNPWHQHAQLLLRTSPLCVTVLLKLRRAAPCVSEEARISISIQQSLDRVMNIANVHSKSVYGGLARGNGVGD